MPWEQRVVDSYLAGKLKRTEMTHDTQDESSTCSGSDSKSSGSSGCQQQQYDPSRVVSPEQLQAFDLLVHPVWIFDFVHRRNRYANAAGLRLWNAPCLEEFLNRDMKQISPAAEARSQHAQNTIEAGKLVEEQWTFYPKGKAKTVHLTMTGLRLSHDEDHCCMLLYGVPLVKENLLNESLRGVEMIRHLPMAVCQFDLEGKVMFQNPAAHLPGAADDCSDEEDSPEKDARNDRVPSGEIITSSTDPEEHRDFPENDDEDEMNDEWGNIPASSASLPTKSGDFIHRFVNRKVAREVLQAIRTQDQVNLEAELRTSHGPQWSAIQLRKTHDPVTSEPVILYSAQDKSDAVEAKRHREASIKKSEFLAIMAHEIR